MSPINRSMLEKYLRGECTAEEEAHVRHWFDLNDTDQYPPVMPERGYARKERKLWLRLSRSLRRDGMAPVSRPIRFTRLLPYAAALVLLVAAVVVWRQSAENPWQYGRSYRAGPGEIKQVSLPDGTGVMLNSMSEIHIDDDYGKEERRVYLEGEAYFLVVEDSLKAFTVHANNIATTALGTMFNVSAYPGEDEIIVSLNEGKVAVSRPANGGHRGQQLVLRPGEEAVCPGNGQMVRQSFNAMERLGWKDHVIYFEQADLPEVIRKLERYYGVRFHYRELEGARWELTGEYRHVSLKAVLESLSFNYGIKYEINDNEVTLFK